MLTASRAKLSGKPGALLQTHGSDGAAAATQQASSGRLSANALCG